MLLHTFTLILWLTHSQASACGYFKSSSIPLPKAVPV